MPGLLGGLGPGVARAGDGLEGRRGVGELGDARAEAGEVGVGLGGAWRRQVHRPRLSQSMPTERMMLSSSQRCAVKRRVAVRDAELGSQS
jgi:hypothetical protein